MLSTQLIDCLNKVKML